MIIDQDARGPATTDLLSVLFLLQSPEVEPLGITVVSGDQWRDEEVAHTLRLLELLGRTEIPVVPGAVFPLLNSKEEAERRERLFGRLAYKGAWNEQKVPGYDGAWNRGQYYGPFVVPPLPEGRPSARPAEEHAANFIIRMLRKFPRQVTLFAAGPLTNVALAVRLDPAVPELACELVVMGGSLSPIEAAELHFSLHSRREFNFWWDPEAAQIVLRSAWKKVTVTPVDISIKTRLTRAMIKEIGKATTPAARYVACWADEEYMWDELAAAAWLEPSLITRAESLYMDVDINHGAGYGDTLTWRPGENPGLGERLVRVHLDADTARFYRMFIKRITRPVLGA
ncbi:MAG: nucleoside hydrolase [Candidatus Acidiferrales bacterium]